MSQINTSTSDPSRRLEHPTHRGASNMSNKTLRQGGNRVLLTGSKLPSSRNIANSQTATLRHPQIVIQLQGQHSDQRTVICDNNNDSRTEILDHTMVLANGHDGPTPDSMFTLD